MTNLYEKDLHGVIRTHFPEERVFVVQKPEKNVY